MVQSISKVYQEKFRRPPRVFVAPARINLIGEHTDYNDGLVMPGAIDKQMVFAIGVSGNDRCNIYASDVNEGVTFSILDLNPGEVWVNYLMGVIDAFLRRGLPVKGVNCVFGGDIPRGAGLSSSAALCAGFGFAINEVFGFGLDRLAIAKIAQSAEHHFAGANVGIMDQYASLFGKKDHLILLDCRSLTHEYLPFHFPEYEILLVDSKVRHSIAASAYNDRRAACEEGVRIIRKKNPAIKSLRDVTRAMLDQQQDELGEDTFIKCRFVVEEIGRTQRAARFLKAQDLKGFGDLMYQTHWGLSKDYEVSCVELDLLVTLAEDDKKVVVGARIMGGGFGGCTINLVNKHSEEKFKEKVRDKYFTTFRIEPEFYAVNLREGVHAITSN